MKNFYSMRNVLNYPDAAQEDAALQLKILADDIAGDEDEAQVRTLLHRFFLDKSFSVNPYEDNVYDATMQSILYLAKINKTSLDTRHRVQIILFGDDVEVINEVPLPPEQMAEVFVRDMYRTSGGTNIGKVVAYQDSSYSRTSPLVTQRKKGDYKVNDIIMTDFHGTDNASKRMDALNRMKRNRLAEQLSNCLCIFFGSEEDKKQALLLARHADNIIALESNLEKYLAPVLIKGTITMADATHISDGETSRKPAQIGKETAQRAQEGERTAAELSGMKLSDKLEYLLGHNI